MLKRRKRVLVGLSGGVDSAVTACLLKKQGYDVTAVHMRFWADRGDNIKKTAENRCCTVEGLTRALYVAKKIDIPLIVLNLESQFKSCVVDYYINTCAANLTPNPCIECNRNIKFGLFLDYMKQFGADYVATGHYARIRSHGGRYELLQAKDRSKDQSYFLYTLTQDKLKYVLFPLGEMTKKRVRRLADSFGIGEINEQKESQNLCFLPQNTGALFLKKHLKKNAFKPGPILTTEGENIGTHQGLPLYTIGQRKGLGIGGIKGKKVWEGNPLYVVAIDRKKNAVIAGPESELFSKKLRAHNLSFVDGQPLTTKQDISAKIRYRAPSEAATLKACLRIRGQNGPRAEIEFLKPQRAITPGQSVVFYKGEKVLGGGIIT